jgi:4-amino-4-deoxy-L-arabinose transferase-like glycosyltransferase
MGVHRIPQKRIVRSPFWLLTITVFLVPTLPRWVTHGLFLDGLIYAAVSRNLAVGVGTFWKPVFTSTLAPEFFAEHPPLGLGIQSLFFRVLGDGFWVENLFSLFLACLTVTLIIWIWRMLAPGMREIAWLPILLWSLIPVVTWAYSYNMLEVTQTVFTLASCGVLIRSLEGRQSMAWGVIAAGLFVCAAVFTKGPGGFFPLAAIILYAVTTRKIGWRAAMAWTGVLTAMVVVAVAVILSSEAARANLVMYFETQLGPSLQGARGGGGSRLRIFETLLAQLGPIIGLALVFLFINRWRWRVDTSDGRRAAAFCLLVAVSASLPIGLSPRQSGHYLLPSFPFYAIGMALLFGPIVAGLVGRIRTHAPAIKIWTGLGAVALLTVVLFSVSIFGQIGRDRDLIEDVWRIEKIVGTEKTLSTCRDLDREWIIHGYFCRYGGIELDPSETQRQFFVSRSSACNDGVVREYHRVGTDTQILTLFEREVGEAPIGGR